jgi:hypothetical protein
MHQSSLHISSASIASSILAKTLCHSPLFSRRCLRKYTVTLWDPLKTRDGVCEAARAPGPSPNVLGSLSYWRRASLRLQKEVPTFARKRCQRLKWR